MIKPISHGLRNLGRFSGHDPRSLFWPYAGFVIVLTFAGFAAVAAPVVNATVAGIRDFAAAHPRSVTVVAGDGAYSIRLEGGHPAILPDVANLAGGLAVVFLGAALLLGAAIARRLHDTGRSAFWGFLPIPFIAIALVGTPRVFASFTDPTGPDYGLFFALFFNNLAYLASLAVLVLMLSGASRARPQSRRPA